jgi:hypothetical protein
VNEMVRFRRRNRVDERNALGLAAIGGVVAAVSGARPTGFVVVDVVMVFVAVGAVIWAAASAPWWAPATAAGVAAVIALDPLFAFLGAVGFVGGLVIGVQRRDHGELRVVVAAIAFNVLIRSDLQGFLGLSAIIGVAAGVMLFVIGLRRRPSTIRRTGWQAIAGVGVVAAMSLLAIGMASLSARPDVTQAARQAKQAVDTLNEGDYEGAALLFEDASSGFARADRALGGPLALPAHLLPGVAQNVGAGADLSAAAADATSEAAAALRQIDPTTLKLSGGSIDLDAVRAVEAPLLRVQDALSALRTTVDNSDSPWIVSAVRDKLDELQADFDDNEPRLQNAIDAVQLAPGLLGGDGVRRYLIMFTSPAEARGLGGFVGNFAEIAINNGSISLNEFARRSDLEAANLAERAFCSGCPEELLAHYGQYGFNTGPDGSFGARGWSNITMPAHFPYIADAAQILYSQNGGNPIDGVIVMDPYVIQALMQYTGPIPVPEFDLTVQPEDTAQFILEDQYILAGDEGNSGRIDALGTLGDQVISRLLGGSLPEPPELAKDLGPLVAERRLLMWTDDEAEQALLDRVGLLGSIPDMGTDGGFSVSVTNGSASKIEVFLERDADVAVEVAGDGTRTLVADVRLTNNAPTGGLPRYVIGNWVGLPDGWSRLLVTFYGPDSLESATVNGEPFAFVRFPEAGWTGYSVFVDLSPGQQRSFTLTFDLEARVAGDNTPLSPTIWEQPLTSRT